VNGGCRERGGGKGEGEDGIALVNRRSCASGNSRRSNAASAITGRKLMICSGLREARGSGSSRLMALEGAGPGRPQGLEVKELFPGAHRSSIDRKA
jgi:hypothetical protein